MNFSVKILFGPFSIEIDRPRYLDMKCGKEDILSCLKFPYNYEDYL